MKARTLIAGFIGITAIIIAYVMLKPEKEVIVKAKKNPWWSATPPQLANNDTSIRPFKVHVEQNVLDDLKARLNNIRTYRSMPGWDYGTQSQYLLPIIEYWKNEYDWRKQEKILNSFDHFKTNMYGIDIHFIHAKPKSDVQTNSLPVKVVLLIHGWPGSVFEFYKAIPMLTKQGYTVVAPSLPGYGFSDAPEVSGLGPVETASIFAKLMNRLGYEKYYVQGGDWGAAIASDIAKIDTRHCRGIHINLIVAQSPNPIYTYGVGSIFPSLVFPDPEERKRHLPVLDRALDLLHEASYFMIQSTRPDTPGFALNDSPTGLAAWILEKFVRWSGCAFEEDYTACMEKKFTKDELITNVMIYWVTQSITTSMRYYKEYFANDMEARKAKVLIPTGIADFPYELVRPPLSWIKHLFKQVITYNSMPEGGHFAALERPNLLVPDFINFVIKTEELYAQDKIEIPQAN
ncbi:Epoxide hydrolase 1 [Trichoplax sp. H2]|nr:Epoxide hydrolase 1 [Trichoplax sp. H2]|eukprot:RDD39447.1 Epoxide hydrolase 1 [Trichoplax sp. H2]